MTWVAAMTTGFGLGLVSFGSLWLTVRQLVRRPRQRVLIAASRVVRLLLVLVVLSRWLVRESGRCWRG